MIPIPLSGIRDWIKDHRLVGNTVRTVPPHAAVKTDSSSLDLSPLGFVVRGPDLLEGWWKTRRAAGFHRRRICESSAWLGIELDLRANLNRQPKISGSRSKVSVWVIPTNEELMIARHTGTLLGLAKAATESR